VKKILQFNKRIHNHLLFLLNKYKIKASFQVELIWQNCNNWKLINLRNWII